MANNNVFDSVTISRDDIRCQIIEYLKQSLELENIDLTKSSFLSFMVDVLSTMTSNILFYQLSTYKEFFLTKASLPESILNLSAFLGYSPRNAHYASCDVLVTIPLNFTNPHAKFEIKNGFKFKANDVPFSTYYDCLVEVEHNSNITVTITQDTKIFKLPVSIDTNSNTFSFLLPVRQYEIIEEEFTIDEDLQLYQFTYIDVPLKGKLSEVTVEIREPESSAWVLYNQFKSLYLMSASDFGYILRRTGNGFRLYFGNSIIGKQPSPGSTVRVRIKETLGKEGNIIAGSIKSGERIYTLDENGTNQVVNFTVTNPSSAINGEDEESLEEIRQNSIINLVALERLVTKFDYENTSTIVKDIPISLNSIPILKKSDVSGNEISLFTTLNFDNETVPSRNAEVEIPLTTTLIPRNYTFNIDGKDFITIFDMEIDTLNECASYSYTITSVEKIPALITTYNIEYNLHIDKITYTKINNELEIRAHYSTIENDFEQTECEVKILNTNLCFNMVNDSTSSEFRLLVSPYTLVPNGEAIFYFDLRHPTVGQFGQYSDNITIRQNLNDYMLSNCVCDSTSAITTIYDVPVIEKNYYNSIDQKLFELNLIQKLLDTAVFSKYKMLTDFVNLKFSNTTGRIQNMKYNLESVPPVIDIGLSQIPTNPQVGDRYIITNSVDGEWANYVNYIAECSNNNPPTWVYFQPISDMIVYVENKATKYMFAQNKWIVPSYQLPIEIEADVFRSESYTGTMSQLASEIKTVLIDSFKDRFGAEMELHRSEIIDVIQTVEGVKHLRLIKPISDIFFNYDIETFTEKQLLSFAPEYIYFTSSSITIRVY